MVLDKHLLLQKNELHVVDVGASGGIHSRWSVFNPHVRGILFEPDETEYLKLLQNSDEKSLIINSALTDSNKKIEFHLTQKSEASSYYLPNLEFLSKFPSHERFKVLESISIQADTLFNQLTKNNILEVDFLKIDTQGSELDILKGSLDLLETITGIEVEVEFAELYKNQPLFEEVHTFLKENKFELFDLKRYYWKRKRQDLGTNKGQLVFGDALYFRSPEEILSIENIGEKKIIRSIYVYLSYGYVDLAKELLELSKERNLLGAESIKKLDLLISSLKSKRTLPNFKGKSKIKNILDNFGTKFSSSGAFAGSDNNLGSN